MPPGRSNSTVAQLIAFQINDVCGYGLPNQAGPNSSPGVIYAYSDSVAEQPRLMAVRYTGSSYSYRLKANTLWAFSYIVV